MRRILDDLEIESPGQSRHPGHIPNLSAVMDRQNRHDLLAAAERLLDPPFRIRNVQVEVRFPAIHQQRRRIEITNHLGRRREGHRGNDHRVVGPEAHGLQSQMQRGGAGIQGHGVFLGDVTGELLLEAFGFGPGGQPAGFQAVQHLANLGVGQTWTVERNLHRMKSLEQERSHCGFGSALLHLADDEGLSPEVTVRVSCCRPFNSPPPTECQTDVKQRMQDEFFLERPDRKSHPQLKVLKSLRMLHRLKPVADGVHPHLFERSLGDGEGKRIVGAV